MVHVKKKISNVSNSGYGPHCWSQGFNWSCSWICGVAWFPAEREKWHSTQEEYSEYQELYFALFPNQHCNPWLA